MTTHKPFDTLKAEIGQDPDGSGECIAVVMRVVPGSEILAAVKAVAAAGSGRIPVYLPAQEARWYGQHVETLSDQLDPENMRVLGTAAWDGLPDVPTHFAPIRVGQRGTKVHCGRWLSAVQQYVPVCPSDGSHIEPAHAGETVTCRICLHTHPSLCVRANALDARRRQAPQLDKPAAAVGYIAMLEDTLITAACLLADELPRDQAAYASEVVHVTAADIVSRVPRLTGSYKGEADA